MQSRASHLATLKAQLARRDAALADRDAAIADRDAKIERLTEAVAALSEHVKRLLSGRGGKHLISKGQGVLFPDSDVPAESESDSESEGASDSDDEDEDPTSRSSRKKRKPRGIDSSSLEREDRVHELPEGERFCAKTGQALVPIGEEVFTEIDFQRPQLKLIRHVTVVYGLAPEQAKDRQVESVTAPLPPRALEGCAASATLLAWLLVQKFANHLPLYRQEQIFARDGLRLPRQTLCDWTLGAAEALRPIADSLMARVRAGPVMQLDDTPVMCQGGKGKKNFQAYLWTYLNPEVGGVAYRFTTGRASDLIAADLAGFEGFLVGDGYSGNRAAANKVAGTIVHAGCWAHTTRKFRDALCEAPGTAKLFQDDIKRLYRIEKEATQAQLNPEARAALRHKKSRTILATLFARARRLKSDFTEAGKIAGAIRYLLNQRTALCAFLKDGRIPLDNNSCERAIRPIAIGRRNWLFAGSPRGGRAAAVVYTLIESCRRADVDMVSYLADVLVRVATHPASRVEELLPDHWTKLVAAGKPAELALA